MANYTYTQLSAKWNNDCINAQILPITADWVWFLQSIEWHEVFV